MSVLSPSHRVRIAELVLSGEVAQARELCASLGTVLDMRGVKLSKADLRDADLSGADLSGADLTGADLTDALLKRADLREACLDHGTLRGADLSGADLRMARLRWVDLRSVRFSGLAPEDLQAGEEDFRLYRLEGADLRWSNLGGVDLGGVDLGSADLGGALYTGGTQWPPGTTAPTSAFRFDDRSPSHGSSPQDVDVPGYGTLAMRVVASGTFQMGTVDDDEEAHDDERLRHEVRLSRAFQLSPTPVTQGLYEAVMGNNPSHFRSSAEHPVERVSWFDAVRFCNALSERCGLSPAYTIGEGDEPAVSCDFSSSGLRLPTAAEWEYAARAGQDFIYSGSNNADEVAWHRHNSDSRTHPVGLRNPNALGLYDMSGNVWEWCWDWFEEYPQDASVDPSGPSTGSIRVNRGGSWLYGPALLRTADRYGLRPADAGSDLGLRLSRS